MLVFILVEGSVDVFIYRSWLKLFIDEKKYILIFETLLCFYVPLRFSRFPFVCL